MLSETLSELLDAARNGHKWALARLISTVESSHPDDVLGRGALFRQLAEDAKQEADCRPALVLGVTGTPGAGKSSLINVLLRDLLQRNEQLTIAVLAIDPSSQNSGGSILGDRTRMDFAGGSDRLFVRSQASDRDLGGLGRKTFQVTRLLKYFFDLVLVETVGIGQSEVEVERLADRVYLVMQPLAGDQVQFIKAGIMEMPDAFVVNKCDEESLARSSYNVLRSSLKITQKHDEDGVLKERPIFMTSAHTGRGIEELSTSIQTQLNDVAARRNEAEIERYFLRKWIADAYGQFGLTVFAAEQDSAVECDLYEDREQRFLALINQRVS